MTCGGTVVGIEFGVQVGVDDCVGVQVYADGDEPSVYSGMYCEL